MAKLQKGDNIGCFWLPHPKTLGRDQHWSNGKVLERKGEYVKMSAKVNWGRYHQFWVKVDSIRPFLKDKYT